MEPLNLLYQLGDYAVDPLGTLTFDDALDDFIRTCQAWRTKQITMLDSWKDAEIYITISPRGAKDVYLPQHIEFYERLNALGLEIYDRDGIYIRDPPGARFLEALRSNRN